MEVEGYIITDEQDSRDVFMFKLPLPFLLFSDDSDGTYYSHCSPLRKAKPMWISHFAKGKTDCGRPNKIIPFS